MRRYRLVLRKQIIKFAPAIKWSVSKRSQVAEIVSRFPIKDESNEPDIYRVAMQG